MSEKGKTQPARQSSRSQGDQIDICKTILKAITHALKSEELRLNRRSPLKRRPWTVSGVYTEDWVCYLLVRELAERCPDEWEFDREQSRVDLSICGRATVELKGPHAINEKRKRQQQKLIQEVLRDFEKQHVRAEQAPKLEHFVLLILHATKSDSVQQWLAQLESAIGDSSTRIDGHQAAPFVLNGDQGFMKCCLYSVR